MTPEQEKCENFLHVPLSNKCEHGGYNFGCALCLDAIVEKARREEREQVELSYRGLYRESLLSMINVCVDSNPAVQKGWSMAITNMLSIFDPMDKPETFYYNSIVEQLKAGDFHAPDTNQTDYKECGKYEPFSDINKTCRNCGVEHLQE